MVEDILDILERAKMEETHSLVFPAASKPSMSRRISRDPKILPMIFETEPPIVSRF